MKAGHKPSVGVENACFANRSTTENRRHKFMRNIAPGDTTLKKQPKQREGGRIRGTPADPYFRHVRRVFNLGTARDGVRMPTCSTGLSPREMTRRRLHSRS